MVPSTQAEFPLTSKEKSREPDYVEPERTESSSVTIALNV